MSVAKSEGYASAQSITGRFALRVELSLQVGNAVHRAVHRLKVDLEHTAVAREESPGPVLALDPGVQDVADRRVADQRELRVVRAGIIEQCAVAAFWRAGPASVRGERPGADARTFGGHGAPRRKGAQPGRALTDGQRCEHDGDHADGRNGGRHDLGAPVQPAGGDAEGPKIHMVVRRPGWIGQHRHAGG